MKTIYSITYYLLIGTLSWIIGILALSKYIKNRLALVLGASAIAIAIILITYCINLKKQPKKDRLSKQNKEIIVLEEYLLYSAYSEKLTFLKQVLAEYKCKKSTNSKYLHNDKLIIVPILTKTELELSDVLDIIANYSAKYSEILIICINYNTELSKILAKYANNLKIINIKQLYHTYVENKFEIPTPPITPAAKTSLKRSTIKNTMLNENNWKKYLGLGFCVLTFGIFNRQQIYFIIFASFFWFLSIITLSKKLFSKN